MTCPACRSPGMIYDPETGEECCGSCGMVMAGHAGNARDVRADDRHAPMLPGAGSTVVGYPGTEFSRLRKSDARCRVRGAGPVRAKHMVRLHTMHDILGLPAPARRHAEALYIELAQDGFTAGRTVGGVMAASAYVACRELGIPRTLRGAAAAGGVKYRTFCRYVRQILDARREHVPQYGLPYLVALVANNLGVEGPCRREAIEAAGRLDPAHSAGKSPMTVAAAILYVALAAKGEPYSQQDVADAAGVCAASVRTRSQEIRTMCVAGE